MERKIVWNKRPVKFFLSALTWISKDSIKQAERIERDILAAIESLIENPEKFPPDKFKKNNTGHFRAFEMLSFHVSYR
jgi:plasmid stabilization system protein ParE